MRSVALAALLLAACSDPADPGPLAGRWVDDAANADDGWTCVAAAGTCTPPVPFTPSPSELTIDSGHVEWVGAVEHEGAIDGDCIDVPSATEGGHLRSEYRLCHAVVNGQTREDTIGAHIVWDAGTANECGCFVLLSALAE